MNNRTKLKVLTVLHDVMGRARRVWKLPRDSVTDGPSRYDRGFGRPVIS